MGLTNFDEIDVGGAIKVNGTQVVSSAGEITANIKDTLTEGSIYVGDAANETSELAIGANGYVLTSNGTTASWQASAAEADTLQTVFDRGQTITIADTDNQVFTINQNDVTNNPIAVAVNNAGTGADAYFTNTNAGATGVQWVGYHNSASPAGSDVVLTITGEGKDDGGNDQNYGSIKFAIGVATDTSEQGSVDMYAANGAGTETLVGSFAWESSTAPVLVLGDGTNAPTLTTAGATNLVLDTNAGSTSSSITITQGAAGNILLTPDAAGQVVVGNAGNVAVITSAGLDLALQSGGASVASFLIGSAAASNVVLTLDTTGQFQVSGTGGTEIYTNDSGSTGAILDLYHDSSSPSVADNTGLIRFYGKDDGGNKTEYAKINTQLLTVTDGGEESYLYFSTHNGASGISAVLGLYWLSGSPVAEFGDGTAAPTIQSGGSQELTIGTGGGNADLNLTPNGSGAINLSGSALVFADALDMEFNTTTGTKIGTATSQKIGFFDATPVVQQNGTGETTGFTAGAGTGVNDDSTFTGNVGATAYRINDVVKALKNLGFLAA